VRYNDEKTKGSPLLVCGHLVAAVSLLVLVFDVDDLDLRSYNKKCPNSLMIII